MKPKLAALILIFVASLSASAQQRPPAKTEPEPAFQVSTLAIAWHGAGATDAGTDAVGTFVLGNYPKTRASLALRTDNFIIPSPGLEISTGGLQYSRRFGANWQWSLNAGIGAVTAPTPSHFAGNFGGGVAYDIVGNKTFSWNAVQVQGIVGRYTLAPNGPDGELSLAVSTGLKISF